MFGLSRRQVLAGLAAIVMLVALVSAALVYLFPAPPSQITIATAFKGGSFDYYGRLYREKLARSNVAVELRETEGAVENLRLLQDEHSGVQIAFVTGGVSDGTRSPGLLSLGTIDYLPIWIFYVSAEPFDRLSQLRGKRVAVGPVGSGTRFTAEQVLGKGGITSTTAQFLPLAGNAAAKALKDGEVDVVWILSSPETPAVQSLLRDPRVRLMAFPMAEAYTRIFPHLVRLVLPHGVIDIDQEIPPADVPLIAATNRVLVRSDLHPAIVNLLLETMVEVHGQPGIFERAQQFPAPTDTDYPMAASAVDFYKNGPSFLQKHLPLWLTVHAQRAIAVLVAGVAIGFPLFRYVPQLYQWNIRRRLLYWYGQLKALDASIHANSVESELFDKRIELDRIEDAVSRIRFPLAFTDQLYDLRGHIEIVRRRLMLPHAR